MEFHPFRTRRRRNAIKQAEEVGGMVATAIMEHLHDNGDVELAVPVGDLPYKTDLKLYLSYISSRVTMALYDQESIAEQYAGRLRYDSNASHCASTRMAEIQDLSKGRSFNAWKPEINPEGLTMVFVPVEYIAKTARF